MNRFFKILWLEDERLWFNSAKREVDRIIKKYCLTPEITRKVGGDYTEEEICGSSYDLLLIDYQLASDETGEKILKQIRQNNILTDTLFYSSEEDAMIAAIHEVRPPIDGVFYTKRDIQEFIHKVEHLIDKIVKRSEDLVNLRGFVLDDSCDFEVRVQELLNLSWNKFNADQKRILEEAVHRHIDEPIKKAQKNKYRVTKTEPFYPAAINDRHFYTHSDRLYLLTKVIRILEESYAFTLKPQHSNFKQSYESDISCYRNALGHRNSRDSHIMIGDQQIPVDAELHKKMRNTLTLYDELISELESFLSQHL